MPERGLSLTSSLADDVPNKVVWFGVDVPIYKETAFELSDAVYCIHCKTEYEYDYRTYSHLGGFRCPKCGYHRQTPQVGVTQVVRTGADSSDIVLNAFGIAMMCTLIFREVTIFTRRRLCCGCEDCWNR